jgi:hypothetical protein
MARQSRGGALAAFVLGALLMAAAGVGYLVWTDLRPARPLAVELSLPKGPALPDPAPMPNPQPAPAPLPTPG